MIRTHIRFRACRAAAGLACALALASCGSTDTPVRRRLLLDDGWRFFRYASAADADSLIYDVRPHTVDGQDYLVADARPTDAEHIEAEAFVLKPWILPSGNDFVADPSRRHVRPQGNPGADFPFVRPDFVDTAWQLVDLPHDWAASQPFMQGWNAEVGGGMGRLPVNGVAWYRRSFDLAPADTCRSVFLDVEGAMSYAMVWLNGVLVGGWPYGYNSWRLDLTPYVKAGSNTLAFRLDNPNNSSRWYPGAGLYRHVWLTLTDRVHVAQWGTRVATPQVSETHATVHLDVRVANDNDHDVEASVSTLIYEADSAGCPQGMPVAEFELSHAAIAARADVTLTDSTVVANPKLWGPRPEGSQQMYVAVTYVSVDGRTADRYTTPFGIRRVTCGGIIGLFVNGQKVRLQGVNQHHDLGCLGAAFNRRAAERQLQLLAEAGCNAIRLAHNPPAPELLDLCDRMGFLVIDEVFDSWQRKKTPLDFHLIFDDWSEQDARAMVRRDRNHPSVIVWSVGNEVGEQYTDSAGAAVGARLRGIVLSEDPTRPVTASMNFAKPHMPFPTWMDIISLNYQGEGIRQEPEFEGTDRIRTAPQYDAFHERFPEKMIISSESASAFSSRGVYYFPVAPTESSPLRDGRGGNSDEGHVSSYELYAVDFGSSADRVFRMQDSHGFVAGEFVWTGWDHLGEPTPYYQARSSYCGFIDMAGFRKDRFYLYQSRWRPELPMAHILPHWNWPERVGQTVPVHVFTSGDEAELFLNGRSLGRKAKGQYEYRMRWDSVAYEPGQLVVQAYRGGRPWATDTVVTTGPAAALVASADRAAIAADGLDLSFVSVAIADSAGCCVPRTCNRVSFEVSGPGVLVATDNGNPMDMDALTSAERNAFSGRVMAVVRGIPGQSGTITVTARSQGLAPASVSIAAR